MYRRQKGTSKENENVQLQHSIKPIKLMYLNIRSLRNKKDALIKRLKGFEIIILNETWLKNDEVNMFHLPNYSAVFNCRENKTGGGTAIYVSKRLKYTVKESKAEFNKIVIEVQDGKKPFVISTMYRPPQSNILDFIEELETTIHMYRNLLFAGDVNLNLLESNSSTVSDYLNVLPAHGYQMINQISANGATRKTSNTIIDHVFSDMDEAFDIKIENTYCLSDHNAILVN